MKFTRLIPFAASICLIFLGAGSTHADWLQVGRLPALPQAISNNAVTSVQRADGRVTLYSFMGIRNPRQSSTITPASYRLDMPGGAWVPIRNAPLLNNRAKIAANAVAIAGSAYLIGGYTVQGFNERTEHRLFRYDEAADQYHELATVPFPVDDTVTGVFQDRFLYLVSGWHGPVGDNTPRTQVYDTLTNVWTEATPLPGPGSGLFGHSGTLIGNRLIVLDGVRTNGGFQISDKVFIGTIDPLNTGDIHHIEWTELPAHTGAPTYRAAGSQGGDEHGRLLILGGTENPYNYNGTGYNGQPSQPLSQALAFDPATLSWQSMEMRGNPLPTMDHRGLVRIAGGWATIGGMVGPGISTSEIVTYTLVPEPCLVLPLILATLAAARLIRVESSSSRRGRWYCPCHDSVQTTTRLK